jgi:hypothetical protein
MKPVELLGTKRGNILKEKIMNMKQTVRIKTSETYIEE